MVNQLFDKLEIFFDSNEFNIVTKAIINLQSQIEKWMRYGSTGAIIYGKPRIGKTRAILYLMQALKEKYGNELPTYVYNVTAHTTSDKKFYQDMLIAIGHPEFDKGTTTVLKDRLINSLIKSACDTRYKKIVFFIDEAYNLTNNDFKWLMDIYNNLNLRDIHMTTFLFGTQELRARKRALIMGHQQQIIGRFMVEETSFKGIVDVKDITVTLLNFDKPIKISNEEIILTQVYFPDAFADGKRLSICAIELMDSFLEEMEENNIITIDIPMKYYMNTVKYCLYEYGIQGKGIYFPDKAVWKDSIRNSGYINSEIASGDKPNY